MQLLVSNPPRSTRRLRRRRKSSSARRAKKRTVRRRRRRAAVVTRSAPRRSTVPRKRRSRRRRSFSFSGFARKRKSSRRRRSSRGGLGRSFGGFIPAGVLQTAGGAVAGFIAAPMLLDKLPFAQVKTGNGRIVGKAVAGLALGFIARKAGLPRGIANAIAVGGLMQAGVDVALKAMGRSGFSGLGDFDVDGIESYPSGGDLSGYEDYVVLDGYGDGDPMTGMAIDA